MFSKKHYELSNVGQRQKIQEIEYYFDRTGAICEVTDYNFCVCQISFSKSTENCDRFFDSSVLGADSMKCGSLVAIASKYAWSMISECYGRRACDVYSK